MTEFTTDEISYMIRALRKVGEEINKELDAEVELLFQSERLFSIPQYPPCQAMIYKLQCYDRDKSYEKDENSAQKQLKEMWLKLGLDKEK